MTKDSIVDASVPSPGRIYDYLLGGHHNFEVDRTTAEQMLTLLPFSSKMARLQRWALQDIAHELTVVRGFDTIIDFASGLPTQDHIHTVVPKGTTVIYSDYDPVVVEYAREILGDTPNVYFFEADVRQPEELLGHPEVARVLDGRRDVAFIAWGIAVFLSDEELSRVAQVLYDWSGDRSCWAFNAQAADLNPNHPSIQAVARLYESFGSLLYARTKEQYEQLVMPWQPDTGKFTSLLEWHGFEQSDLAQEDVDTFGPTGAGYGAYLVKS
jgi:hypothetical protein